MKRNTIIAEIRSVQRTCRGPLPDRARQVVNQLLADGHLYKAQMVDAANRSRPAAHPCVIDVIEKPEERRHKLFAVFEGGAVVPYRTGTPCGYDFNEIIVTGQWDGCEHAYTCPKCGVTGYYQAPLYEVE